MLQQLTRIRNTDGSVLVVGLGTSGVATAEFLLRNQIKVHCVESKNEADFRTTGKHLAEVQQLGKRGAEITYGVSPETISQILNQIGLIVLSPGVSPNSTLGKALISSGIPIINEFLLALSLIEGKTLVVTGTNGKSTVVSLIDSILRCSGIESVLCGNIGVPIIAKVPELAERSSSPSKIWVIEASSYQLELNDWFAPDIAVLLNVTDDHLERHGDFAEYLSAKAKLFSRQNSQQFAVLNRDDPNAREISTKASKKFFGSTDASDAVVNFSPAAGVDEVLLKLNREHERYSMKELTLKGRFNRLNVAASILAARLAGATPQGIRRAVVEFLPLRHRLETVVALPGGALVVNDSKSTTVDSTKCGTEAILEQYPGRDVLLLLGGALKQGSWEPVRELLSRERSRFKELVLFGAGAAVLMGLVGELGIPSVTKANLETAVEHLTPSLNLDVIILLSPGGASFDEFRDFGERGDRFCELVRTKIRQLPSLPNL